MGIKKLTLHNFRGFHDAEIELKPLTVLLGPNSAGKSSFGHALAAMSHAHRVFRGTPQADLTPLLDPDTWPVDLGTLDDLRTHGASGPVKVGIETDAGMIEIGFGVDSDDHLVPSYFLHPKGEQSGVEGAGEVPVAGSLEAIGATGTMGPRVIYGNAESNYYQVRRLNNLQWQESGIPATVILDGLLLKSITHFGGTTFLLSGKAREELDLLLRNLAYLGPSRRRPLRTSPRRPAGSSYSPNEIGYSGERIASVLNGRAKESVRYAKLPRIPNTLAEAQENQNEKPTLARDTLQRSVVEWLQVLGLGTSLRSEPCESGELEILVTVPNQQERNLADIGFGTSQILPILTAGLLQPPGSLYIVDLPEAHLHPRPQAELADFFCSLALSDRLSLVETHSEMFFHRLRLRGEMDDELKDKIAVYFIDEPLDGLCHPPRRVGLGLDDQLRWPKGFLQEAWEIEAQIAAVRQPKQRTQK
jgi:predicted ATPase